MPLSARLPTVACHAATGRGRRRLPASGTESLSSVTSSPEGIRRSTGSAATVPASTTTLTVTIDILLLNGGPGGEVTGSRRGQSYADRPTWRGPGGPPGPERPGAR